MRLTTTVPILLSSLLLSAGAVHAADLFSTIESSDKLIKRVSVSSTCNSNAFTVDGSFNHLVAPCTMRQAACPKGMMPYIKRGQFAQCQVTNGGFNFIDTKLSFKSRRLTCTLNAGFNNFVSQPGSVFNVQNYNTNCSYAGLLPDSEPARVDSVDHCELPLCDAETTTDCNASPDNTVQMRGTTTGKVVCVAPTVLASQPGQCTPVRVTATLVCGKIMKKSMLNTLGIDTSK